MIGVFIKKYYVWIITLSDEKWDIYQCRKLSDIQNLQNWSDKVLSIQQLWIEHGISKGKVEIKTLKKLWRRTVHIKMIPSCLFPWLTSYSSHKDSS